jgi:hypothetical protein
MAKFLLKNKKKYFYKEIKKFLKKHNACYVLLTCSDPSKDGNMQVDMAYDGDEVLASYLLENAILVLQERDFKGK